MLAGAAPPFVVEDGVGPREIVEQKAGEAWLEIERVASQASGLTSSRGAYAPIRIRRAPAPRPGRAASSRPGIIEVRDAVDDAPRAVSALKHEVAHQFLFELCPESTADRLFHEAFAMAVSGEAAAWRDGAYVSLPAAKAALERTRVYDSREARAAIARLIAETPAAPLPPALARRLARCGGGARWLDPLSPGELASTASHAAADARIVLSLHSGEVLAAEGAVRTPMPFGSTLKPFVVAGAEGELPVLPPARARPDWSCGEGLPDRVDARTALARSCNGYFADWAAQAPAIASLGSYGPVLRALGFEGGPPGGIEDAIGLRGALAISPWGLAQAYRLLAVARPDLVEALRRTPVDGTLSGLLDDATQIAGWAFKTGTVRDAESRPVLGWIVAVSPDVVVVTARREAAPRTFFAEVAKALAQPALQQRAAAEARVQVFGLVPLDAILAECDTGVVAGPSGPRVLPRGPFLLLAAAREGPALCLGAPFRVRSRDLTGPRAGREYAGIFRFDAIAVRAPSVKAERARRGSELVFSTTLARYTAGVLDAEDAEIRGEPRVALGRVIAHNAAVPRHGARPLCDTTHCQAFRGTAPMTRGDEAIFRAPALDAGWLAFSRGGEEAWREVRTTGEVEAVLGAGAGTPRFRGGSVHYLARRTDARGGLYDAPGKLPCELLRSPLRLPACPERARKEGDSYVFVGRGEGHGEGLDVERAKKSRAKSQDILRGAYGETVVGR